jgi:hypothetical protein
MSPMYTDRHMEMFKKVMRHMKSISMSRRLFWMHLEVHKIVQGAVHENHDPHVQAHVKV